MSPISTAPISGTLFLFDEPTTGLHFEDVAKKYDVKVLLEPYRVPVEVGKAPVRGNPGAPVTVVEFSDFQCPYCVRARPTVNRVREAYGDKVRWVFRHFPLDFHAQAEKAGEAAACAGEQGKFWEMHDLLWTNTAKLQVADLKAHATTLGLDAAGFGHCLDSGRFAGLVAADPAGTELTLTSARGEATELARAASGSVDALYVFGGDGTFNEVLNGIDAETPIGLIPGGGTSVLPRALGLPRDPVEWARHLAHAAVTRRITVGRVNGRRFGVSIGPSGRPAG